MVRLRIGALVAAATIVLAACSGATTSSPPASEAPASEAPASEAPASPAEGTPKDGGTLVVAIPADMSRTDVALVDDGATSYVIQNVVETLVTLKPGTGDVIVPQLAESFETSPDGLTYTFKIRQGVKFHDGTALDAAAVKANFDRWINIPQTYIDAGYTYYIGTVMGYGADSYVAKTEVTDASTFVVTLKAPNSSFLVQLTLTPFGIQSPTAIAAGNGDNPDFTKNTYAQGGNPTMVGTGAFKFKEWVTKDHVTIEKNTEYWDTANQPHLDAVTFKPIEDTTATLNALQAGDIDMTQLFAPVDVPTVKGDTNLQYFDRGGSCNAGTLKMNHAHAPFDNVKIRQAVAYAINSQSIVDTFFGDTGVVLKNWTPPGTKFAKDLDLPTYDPDKAKALIAESGVTDLSFDFWYPSGVSRAYMPDPKGEAEAILTDLEAVGFKPNVKTAGWADTYLSDEAAGKYPMFLIGWNCDWLGIDNFLGTAFFAYHSGKPNPEIAYKNDAMNDAITAAIQAPDDATAQAEWDKVQDFLVQDMPIVPIVAGKAPSAGAAYVKGFIPSPTQLELFKTVWLDK